MLSVYISSASDDERDVSLMQVHQNGLIEINFSHFWFNQLSEWKCARHNDEINFGDHFTGELMA